MSAMTEHPDAVVPIYTTQDSAEAEIIRNALNAEGIRSEIDGGTQGGFVELVEIKILTRAADAERARAFIAERHNPERRGGLS